jgi:hypothetical protein
VATEDDLNALRKRVRDLERSARAAGTSRAGTKRSSGAKSSRGATKAKSAAKRTAPPTE